MAIEFVLILQLEYCESGKFFNWNTTNPFKNTDVFRIFDLKPHILMIGHSEYSFAVHALLQEVHSAGLKKVLSDHSAIPNQHDKPFSP